MKFSLQRNASRQHLTQSQPQKTILFRKLKNHISGAERETSCVIKEQFDPRSKGTAVKVAGIICMDSALLNIWRENGAFLRYGDAKALFLMSVSIAALFSFLRHTLIAPGSDWAQISYIFDADMGLHSWLTVLSFSFSALVSLLVIAPTLSDRMIRVTFFNTLGQCLQRGPIQRAELGFLTFRDIANDLPPETSLSLM